MLAAILVLAQVTPDHSIFDGKTLAGWTIVGGGKWSADSGVLKGVCTKADPQGILVYEKQVEDFTANLQFKISGGNSGFYFRTERIDEQPLVKGMQAEIDAIDDVAGIWETAGRGWVYKPTPEVHATAKFKPGEWTDMLIKVIGTRYIVKLNGAIITDIEDSIGRRKGHVALQLHGDMDMTVEFRNISLTHIR